MRKSIFAYAKTKSQNSCMVTVQLTKAFVFHTYKVLFLQPSSLAMQASLCMTWSETTKTGFSWCSSLNNASIMSMILSEITGS